MHVFGIYYALLCGYVAKNLHKVHNMHSINIQVFVQQTNG